MKRQSFKRMMRRVALMLVLALAIFLLLVPINHSAAQSRQLQQTEAVASWPSKSKRWALVIGVDQYRDGNISPLRGAANDAAKLAHALTDYAGFPADQVILLATDQPEERQPTRINILTYLSNLSSAVPKDGLLLVAFAGHGIERGGQAFLIPSDARLTDDISLLEESAISVERMHQRIRAAQVAQVVVLLDACRNDPGGRADAPNPLTQAYVRGFNFDVRNREVQAFATIYATAVGQRAYEYAEKKQGYFTWALIEGLKGSAANEQGEVTLLGLVKYVQELVPKRIAIDLGAGKKQYPFAVIEGYRAEDLVIAVATKSNKTVTDGSAAAAVTDPAAIELAYWETIKNSNNPDDFRAYLQEYPTGKFAALARIRAMSPTPQPSPPQTKSSTPSTQTNNSDNLPDRPTLRRNSSTDTQGLLAEAPAKKENQNTVLPSVSELSKSSKDKQLRPLSTAEDPRLIGKRNLFATGNIPLSKEVDLGRKLAALTNKENKLIDDPIITEYVNRVGQNIVLHSDAKVPFTFWVIDTSDLNVFALPGGFFYVSSGLILSAGSEAELAALMAHQLAHVVARHGINNWAKTGSESLDVFTKFSRAEEDEADRLAVQYLYSAGYDPFAIAYTSEEKLNERKPKDGNITASFSSHLITAPRLESVRDLVDRFPAREEYVSNNSEFLHISGRLWKRFNNSKSGVK